MLIRGLGMVPRRTGRWSALAAVATLVMLSVQVRADSAPKKLPTYRDMERVTRHIQKPLVTAVVGLHASVASRVDEALSQVKAAESQKKLEAFTQYLPAIQPLAQDFANTPFGMRVRAVAEERLKKTRGQGASPTARVRIHPPQTSHFNSYSFDESSYSTVHLERFQQLGTTFRTDVTTLVSDTGAVTQETLDRVMGLVTTNKVKLSNSQARFDTLTALDIPAAQGMVIQAENVLNDALNALNTNRTAQGILSEQLDGLQTLLGSLGPIAANMGAIANLTSQISQLSAEIQSIAQTINGLNSEISSIGDVLPSLNAALTALSNEAILLDIVDIPFFTVADEILGQFTAGISLSTVFGAGQNILNALGTFSGIPALIQQVANLQGALDFVTSTFGRILGNLMKIMTNYSSLVSGVGDIVNNPHNLFNVFGDLLVGSGSSLNLASAASSLFGSALDAGIQRVVGNLDLSGLASRAPEVSAVKGEGIARGVAHGRVHGGVSAAQLHSTAGTTARAAVSSPLPFGDPSRKPSSKRTFCSSVKGTARVRRCVDRELKNWKRFEARMRSVVRTGANQLKLESVQKRIEKRAFGEDLSSLLNDLVNQAQRVKIP